MMVLFSGRWNGTHHGQLSDCVAAAIQLGRSSLEPSRSLVVPGFRSWTEVRQGGRGLERSRPIACIICWGRNRTRGRPYADSVRVRASSRMAAS